MSWPDPPPRAAALPRLWDLRRLPYRHSGATRAERLLLRLRLGRLLLLRNRIQQMRETRRLDRAERLAKGPRILRRDAGRIAPRGRSVCLYANYAASGRITRMVCEQVASYARLGFDVIFISTSTGIPDGDWQAVLDHCSLGIQRRNFALDFGSWSDAAQLLQAEIGAADELLLANDSVVGPIRPLDPIFAALRSGGDGVFGLTESLQHSPHLQSYLLLARGSAAVRDLGDFLIRLQLTSDKQRIIARGELALSGAMAARGHRVAALYGYEAVEGAVLADPSQIRRIIASVRVLHVLLGLPPEDRPLHLRRMLFDLPFNPTHTLWLPLVELCGFPFVKTELITKNPEKVPDVLDWPKLVAPDSPCSVETIAEHLSMIRPPGVL